MHVAEAQRMDVSQSIVQSDLAGCLYAIIAAPKDQYGFCNEFCKWFSRFDCLLPELTFRAAYKRVCNAIRMNSELHDTYPSCALKKLVF